MTNHHRETLEERDRLRASNKELVEILEYLHEFLGGAIAKAKEGK